MTTLDLLPAPPEAPPAAEQTVTLTLSLPGAREVRTLLYDRIHQLRSWSELPPADAGDAPATLEVVLATLAETDRAIHEAARALNPNLED